MKKIMKGMLGTMLALTMCSPLLTSCYDDSDLWDALEGVTDRVAQLEKDLKSQTDAMSSLLAAGSSVSKCEKQDDGSFLVTLSDGTKFKVLSQATDFSSLMTYVEVGGARYWALYRLGGEAELLKDASGKNIPVSTKVDVAVKDGKYHIVINGVEYPTGYDVGDMVQVFESCTPHADASGNVYALTFSFGEGRDITVSVDGYKGVVFRLETIGGAAEPVSEYYVPYGSTQSFLIDLEGVVDYALQIPYGWKVVERQDKLTDNVYLDITAPSRALVESGAAFAGGDLKAMAVVEGGDAAITRMVLSSEPFKSLEFSSTRLLAEPYDGVVKFVYGLVLEAEFDEAAVLANVEKLITSNSDAPAGYVVSETAVNLAMNEILGEDLDPEVRYVAFVIPALYDAESESVYYVDPSLLVTYEFGAILTKMSEPLPSLFDAEITVEVIGTDKMWAGTAVKEDNIFEDIIYAITNGITEPVDACASYSGPASGFPSASENAGVSFLPGVTYVTWCVPVDPDKVAYTEDDIIYREFTTKPVVAGGALEVVAGETAVSVSSIAVPVSAEGATMIYYAYLTETEAGRLGNTDGFDEQKFDIITKSDNFTVVMGDEAVAELKTVKPESTMWLFAVAVDADGKYGKVKCLSSTLPKVTFNGISLSYANIEIGSDKVEFQIVATGDTPVRYIYWVGTVNDPFWVKCGKIRQDAEKYMAVYPDDEAIAKVMRANGEISEDGKIVIGNLRMEEEYVIMVLAQDESGKFSKGAYKKITTLAADLGTIRTTGSELWNAAKETIKIEWIPETFEAAASQNMLAQYGFDFSCPQEYTAHVLCASDNYFEDAGITKNTQIIIEIENFCSRKYDDGRTVERDGEILLEPDYYADGEKRGGQMMNVYRYYVHGVPTRGFVTYFASGSHGDGNCIYWENGADVNYQRALDLIAEHCTLAPYERRAASFGLKGQEAADWAQDLLTAYLPFYENAVPIIYENDGSPLRVMTPNATGVNEKGVVPDRVVVVLKDRDGNYFEPMYFEVPNYFED